MDDAFGTEVPRGQPQQPAGAAEPRGRPQRQEGHARRSTSRSRSEVRTGKRDNKKEEGDEDEDFGTETDDDEELGAELLEAKRRTEEVRRKMGEQRAAKKARKQADSNWGKAAASEEFGASGI